MKRVWSASRRVKICFAYTPGEGGTVTGLAETQYDINDVLWGCGVLRSLRQNRNRDHRHRTEKCNPDSVVVTHRGVLVVINAFAYTLKSSAPDVSLSFEI